MHYSSFVQDAILATIAALTLAPTVAAHGHVKSISVNGQTYPGAVPVRCTDIKFAGRVLILGAELVLSARQPGCSDCRLAGLEPGQRYDNHFIFHSN